MKWNIVGHSMGGGTAEAMALMKPWRTKSLTILDGMIFLKNENVNVAIVGLTNHPLYREMLISYTQHSYLSFNHFRNQTQGNLWFPSRYRYRERIYGTLAAEGNC